MVVELKSCSNPEGSFGGSLISPDDVVSNGIEKSFVFLVNVPLPSTVLVD